MVQINNCFWLTEPYCINHEQNGDEFDQRLNRFLRASYEDLTVDAMTQLRDLEKMASVSTTCVSQRQQQAKFFFLGGRFLEQMSYNRLAHEYYTLCERRLPPRDFAALLVLHTTWVDVIEALGYSLLALHSYRKIVAWLQIPALQSASFQLSVQCYQLRLEQCRARILNGEERVTRAISCDSFNMPLLQAS